VDRQKLTIRKLLKGLGIKLMSLDQSSGHIRATISRGDVVKKVTFPVTPSDSRWERNQRSFLRKLFNNANTNTHTME